MLLLSLTVFTNGQETEGLLGGRQTGLPLGDLGSFIDMFLVVAFSFLDIVKIPYIQGMVRDIKVVKFCARNTRSNTGSTAVDPASIFHQGTPQGIGTAAIGSSLLMGTGQGIITIIIICIVVNGRCSAPCPRFVGPGTGRPDGKGAPTAPVSRIAQRPHGIIGNSVFILLTATTTRSRSGRRSSSTRRIHGRDNRRLDGGSFSCRAWNSTLHTTAEERAQLRFVNLY